MDRQRSADYFEVRRTSALMERPLLARSGRSVLVGCQKFGREVRGPPSHHSDSLRTSIMRDVARTVISK